MSRLFIAIMVTLLATMLLPGMDTSAQGKGNSGAAHACRQGGYLALQRHATDGGGPFDSVGECVSYAARGGTLVELGAGDGSGDGPESACADYESLAPAANPSLDFNDQAACQAFVDRGGTLAPYDPDAPQIFLYDLNDLEGGDCEIGIGLRRFAPNTAYEVDVVRQAGAVDGSPFTLTTDSSGNTDPTAVITSVPPDAYIAAVGYNGVDYSHLQTIPTTGSC